MGGEGGMGGHLPPYHNSLDSFPFTCLSNMAILFTSVAFIV